MVAIFNELLNASGLANASYKELLMVLIALGFIYLAVVKKIEPFLLLPLSFGILLANLPQSELMNAPSGQEIGGILYYLYQGIQLGIYPPLIFICLGASTDFSSLIANPKTLFLGGAAQVGIFFAFFGSLLLGMTPQEASSVAIIGGADGPTTIFITSRLAIHLLPAVALAAYSYMALIPIIQPPIMRFLTTKKERQVEMKQMRVVTQKEKILFPIVVTLFVGLVIPSAITLIGMLMIGNLIREVKELKKLAEVLQNELLYLLTLLIGLTVGASATAETFLTKSTLLITVMGLVSFIASTAFGVLMGKVMCKLTKQQVNPLIGAAGVSAMPMAARVVQREGNKYNSNNYLLPHALGPNVAGIIATAIVAGIFLSIFG